LIYLVNVLYISQQRPHLTNTITIRIIISIIIIIIIPILSLSLSGRSALSVHFRRTWTRLACAGEINSFPRLFAKKQRNRKIRHLLCLSFSFDDFHFVCFFLSFVSFFVSFLSINHSQEEDVLVVERPILSLDAFNNFHHSFIFYTLTRDPYRILLNDPDSWLSPSSVNFLKSQSNTQHEARTCAWVNLLVRCHFLSFFLCLQSIFRPHFQCATLSFTFDSLNKNYYINY